MTWLIHTFSHLAIPICHVTHVYVWHNPSRYVTWRIPISDMTHPYLEWSGNFYMWRDSCLFMTWVMSRCDMTNTHEWHLIHTRAMAHSYLCQSSVRISYVTSCHTYESVMSYMWMSHATHMDAPSPTAAPWRDIPHVWHGSLLCVIRLAFVTNDSFSFPPVLPYPPYPSSMCGMSDIWHKSHVIWLVCNVTV